MTGALIRLPVTEYRRRVRETYAPAFALHDRVATAVEARIRATRRHSTVVHVALDMLLIQAYKAHIDVSVLCQLGSMEDAATLTRRLLELTIQAVYIGDDKDNHVRLRRAGQYLAFLWRQFPRANKQKLPAKVRGRWSKIARSYGRFVRATAKSWGPNWRDMFDAVGHLATYETDYRLMSGIAHGSPTDNIIAYSRQRIPIRSHEYTSAILTFATGYLLMTAGQWGHRFRGRLTMREIEPLFNEYITFRDSL